MIIIDNDFSPSPFVIDQVLIGLLLSSMHEARATKKSLIAFFSRVRPLCMGNNLFFSRRGDVLGLLGLYVS